jgi:hypothetical protein
MRILLCGGELAPYQIFHNSFDLLQSKYIQQANTPSVRVYLFCMIYHSSAWHANLCFIYVWIRAAVLMFQGTLAICEHIKTT